MPTPCFTGTCSIDLDYDPVFGLIAAARLADTGSVACVDRPDPDDTDGLFVKIAGLTLDGTSGVAPGSIPCGQSLARATDGQMFAFPEGVTVVDPVDLDPTTDDDIQDVGGAAGYNANTLINTTLDREWTVTNPYDCDAWCWFTVSEMKVLGSRLPDSGGPGGVNHTGGESFFFTGQGFIDVPGDVINAFNRVDIHGSWSGEGEAPDHQFAWDMHALFPLTPGQTKTVRAAITVVRKYHFYMVDDDFGDGGVAMLHPSAMLWRDEPTRP